MDCDRSVPRCHTKWALSKSLLHIKKSTTGSQVFIVHGAGDGAGKSLAESKELSSRQDFGRVLLQSSDKCRPTSCYSTRVNRGWAVAGLLGKNLERQIGEREFIGLSSKTTLAQIKAEVPNFSDRSSATAERSRLFLSPRAAEVSGVAAVV